MNDFALNTLEAVYAVIKKEYINSKKQKRKTNGIFKL